MQKIQIFSKWHKSCELAGAKLMTAYIYLSVKLTLIKFNVFVTVF